MEEVSSEILGAEIISDPVSELRKEARKDIIVTSRGNVSYRKAITMTATAYMIYHSKALVNAQG